MSQIMPPASVDKLSDEAKAKLAVSTEALYKLDEQYDVIQQKCIDALLEVRAFTKGVTVEEYKQEQADHYEEHLRTRRPELKYVNISDECNMAEAPVVEQDTTQEFRERLGVLLFDLEEAMDYLVCFVSRAQFKHVDKWEKQYEYYDVVASQLKLVQGLKGFHQRLNKTVMSDANVFTRQLHAFMKCPYPVSGETECQQPAAFANSIRPTQEAVFGLISSCKEDTRKRKATDEPDVTWEKPVKSNVEHMFGQPCVGSPESVVLGECELTVEPLLKTPQKPIPVIKIAPPAPKKQKKARKSRAKLPKLLMPAPVVNLSDEDSTPEVTRGEPVVPTTEQLMKMSNEELEVARFEYRCAYQAPMGKKCVGWSCSFGVYSWPKPILEDVGLKPSFVTFRDELLPVLDTQTIVDKVRAEREAAKVVEVEEPAKMEPFWCPGRGMIINE